MEIRERARCSPEHRYRKDRAAKRFITEGWSISIEEPVNGFADIVAERDTRRVVIEIETSAKDSPKS